MQRTPFIAVVSLALWSTTAAAELKIIGKSKVGFDAQGPGGLEIPGKTNDLSVTDNGDKVVFTVKMDTVSTGIDLRDNHMCDKYAHCEKYPVVTLTMNRSDIPLPEDGDATATVSATFNAHGVDQPTQVALEVKKKSNGWQVEGTFPFNTEKHGIEIPSYLGVTADPDMKGHAKFILVDV